MEIRNTAMAGTLESSDCQIMIRPNPDRGVEIELESVVAATFGKSIRNTVRETLKEFGVKDAEVEIHDRGALDCVIKARLACVICRGAGERYDWTRED